MGIYNKYRHLIVVPFLSVLIILGISCTAFANSAYSGYIKIYVKNAPEGYMLDILTQSQKPGFDGQELDKSIKDSPLYKYEKDGWYSSARIDRYFFPQDRGLAGDYDRKTGLRVHTYGHRGMPESVKIAIQLPDGMLKVSDEIKIDSVANDLLFDASTAQVSIISNFKMFMFDHNTSSLVKAIAISLLLTLLVEGAWVLTFLGKKGFWFLPVNLFTQTVMHTILILMFYNGMRAYMPGFIYGFEIVLPLVEAFIYKAMLKDAFSMKRLLVMSVLANVSSFYIGFAIGI